MGLVLSYLRGVYNLDTLDTRFTSSSSVPYRAVVDARSNAAASGDTVAKERARAQPCKWNTPEFYLYYIIFVTVVPYMFWIAYDVSRCRPTLRLLIALNLVVNKSPQHPTRDTTSSSLTSLLAGCQAAWSTTPTRNTTRFAGTSCTWRRSCCFTLC